MILIYLVGQMCLLRIRLLNLRFLSIFTKAFPNFILHKQYQQRILQQTERIEINWIQVFQFAIVSILTDNNSQFLVITVEKKMDKHTWNRVQVNSRCQTSPIARWGHSCCVINNEIVFFGGYADSNYMNDVWSFDTTTMEWSQVKTNGDIPANRSNCSMNYDSENNRIVIFGGGGPNKKRFNSISLLDWTTKEWTEINPKENQAAPWQRTYHSAELIFPYLVVFGGQGVADLDDLWIFNFQTLSWKEVPVDKEKSRPCARRFHSSVVVGNEFFVIAGCHSKYKPLNDVYSLDLTSLLKNGRLQSLEWKQRKLKGSAFLSRWGQSSSVYQDKIYIFGGRFSNDLNDVLIIDLQKQSMKTLKVGTTDSPKPRRRHCGCFVGSSLVIFGGFNGEYFNDLYYINVFEVKSKLSAHITSKTQSQNQFKYLNNQDFYDHILHTTDNNKVYIAKGLISDCFKSNQIMENFLSEMDQCYCFETMMLIFRVLYQGYGILPIDPFNLYKFKLNLPETQQQLIQRNFSKILDDGIQIFKKVQTSPVVSLNQKSFNKYIEQSFEKSYFDITLQVNKLFLIPINSAKLINNSKCFEAMLVGNYCQNYWNQTEKMDIEQKQQQNRISLQRTLQFEIPFQNSLRVFEILLNYLQTGYVVIPQNFNEHNWIEISQLAGYFCIEKLLRICEHQLAYKISLSNIKNFFNFALENSMNYLIELCVETHIKSLGSLLNVNQETSDVTERNKLFFEDYMRLPLVSKVYGQLRFDVAQGLIKKEKSIELSKKDSCSTESQKENYQMNENY